MRRRCCSLRRRLAGRLGDASQGADHHAEFRWPTIRAAEDYSAAVLQTHGRQARRPADV